jgi:hypothetical protein
MDFKNEYKGRKNNYLTKSKIDIERSVKPNFNGSFKKDKNNPYLFKSLNNLVKSNNEESNEIKVYKSTTETQTNKKNTEKEAFLEKQKKNKY